MRFGTFELDLRSRELTQGASRVRLQEQPFEILCLMLERPGHVVTRDELRRRLWPDGTFVDFEHSLNAAVKRLRAALGDDADNPRYVETLPRRGYRFIGPIAATAVAPAPPPAARLAVLPFTSVGDDAGQEYFADGLTEEMIGQLGRLCRGRIGIIARHSSMTFKGSTCRARDIGAALHVGYLLEGSVRRDGDRVRITARLVETAGETYLWVDTYERHLTDGLSLQIEVAARVAQSLALELLPDQRPGSTRQQPAPAAYQSYLKARYFWHKPADDGVAEAEAWYREAITADPSFAAAYAGLARAFVTKAEFYRGCPHTALEEARTLAQRALQVDASLAEAHQALGDVHRLLRWDLESARASYARVLALNPSFEAAYRANALLLTALGQYDEARREADRSCELDPLCLTVATAAAWVRFAAGDHAWVIDRCRHTLEMDENYAAARRLLAAALLLAGDGRAACATFEDALARSADDHVALAGLAHARAVLGDRAGAMTLCARLDDLAVRRYVSPYHVAIACTGLSDADGAVAALTRAAEDHDPALPHLAVDPRLAPLREDPRIIDLRARLGV